jgi:hypothetical protein
VKPNEKINEKSEALKGRNVIKVNSKPKWYKMIKNQG